MSKKESLKELEEELAQDKSLPLQESNLVFGEGNPASEVMFIGEAPGLVEDQLKRPFVGRAGQLLDKLILMIGWRRQDVYITNIVKRRPPANRDPLPQELEAYAPYLARQIEIINPKLIVTLGRFAMNYFLPGAKISRDQGKLFRVGKRFVYPLFHPAAALRDQKALEALTSGFKKLPAVLKKLDSTVEATLPPKNLEQQKLF